MLAPSTSATPVLNLTFAARALVQVVPSVAMKGDIMTAVVRTVGSMGGVGGVDGVDGVRGVRGVVVGAALPAVPAVTAGTVAAIHLEAALLLDGCGLWMGEDAAASDRGACIHQPHRGTWY